MTTPTTSSLPIYLVLADSHAKRVPSQIFTPSHQVIVHSISGLKWRDHHQAHLSAVHLIRQPSFSSILASTTSLLCLIGSNSLRSFTSTQVIEHLKEFIHIIRTFHPQLNHPLSISVVVTFPSEKPSFRFPTISSLHHNIQTYNHELYSLSSLLHIQIVDFRINTLHLAPDRLHLHHQFSHLIHHNILQHFQYIHSSTSISISSSNPISLPSILRSEEARTRRNRRRNQRAALKQASLSLARIVSSEWTITHVKEYLKNHNFNFAKISPIHNRRLRIRFNDRPSFQATSTGLDEHIFSSETFSRMFS